MRGIPFKQRIVSGRCEELKEREMNMVSLGLLLYGFCIHEMDFLNFYLFLLNLS